VKEISRRLLPRSPSYALALALAVVSAAAGCARPHVLKLHYLNGFVPGSHQIFYAARVAVPPPQGLLAEGEHEIGAIYAASGDTQRTLAIANLSAVVQDAIVAALSDAGLHPIHLDSEPAPGGLKPGTDLILTSSIEEVSLVKRFGAEKTVHGRVFTMDARFRIKFTLLARSGEKLYQGDLLGTEQEPPSPVGGEIFLPLETEPAEALSVAMSRAIGKLLLEPELQTHLPLRDRAHASAAPQPH
jgi:hypothetical protein